MNAASPELARDGEAFAQLTDALHDLLAWAQRCEGAGPAPASSAVLRQRMADLVIEHRVTSAVLDEARGAAAAEADGLRRLARRCLVRCLRRAADVVGSARGEPAVAWMREALAARRDEAGRA